MAEPCCQFDPTSHGRSLSPGPLDFLCGLLRVIAWGTKGSEFQSVQIPLLHPQELTSAWTAPDCPFWGNGCLLRLEGCGYFACRQSLSQHLQLQGPWYFFLQCLLCAFPCLEGFILCWAQAAFKHFFPLEKFSKYLPFLFLAVKQRRHRFPCDKADLESTQRLSTNRTSHLSPSLSPNNLFQMQVVSSLSDRTVILSVIIYKCKNGNIT